MPTDRSLLPRFRAGQRLLGQTQAIVGLGLLCVSLGVGYANRGDTFVLVFALLSAALDVGLLVSGLRRYLLNRE